MGILASNNTFAPFFNKFFELANSGVHEGDQGKDTGVELPSMKDRRFKYFITGIIRSSMNALRGEFGIENWSAQTHDNLNKRLARYHDENGNVDMDIALTDPQVLRLMDLCETQSEELSSYTLILNEALDAYRQVYREDFDLTTLTQNTSNPVRKVTATEEEKAQMVARLAKLTAKAS